MGLGFVRTVIICSFPKKQIWKDNSSSPSDAKIGNAKNINSTTKNISLPPPNSYSTPNNKPPKPFKTLIHNLYLIPPCPANKYNANNVDI